MISTLEFILQVSVSYESLVESWNIEPHDQLYFTKNLPDFQQRIDAAKKVPTIPDPPPQEVIATIKFCQETLKTLKATKPALEKAISEIKMPDVNKIMKQAELQMGVKLDKKYKQQIKKQIQDLGPLIVNILYSQVVTILAILSIYLVDHEVYARYPSPDFSKKYDPNLAVVGLFNELASVHDDIIAMITQE